MSDTRHDEALSMLTLRIEGNSLVIMENKDRDFLTNAEKKQVDDLIFSYIKKLEGGSTNISSSFDARIDFSHSKDHIQKLTSLINQLQQQNFITQQEAQKTITQLNSPKGLWQKLSDLFNPPKPSFPTEKVERARGPSGILNRQEMNATPNNADKGQTRPQPNNNNNNDDDMPGPSGPGPSRS